MNQCGTTSVMSKHWAGIQRRCVSKPEYHNKNQDRRYDQNHTGIRVIRVEHGIKRTTRRETTHKGDMTNAMNAEA